MPSGCNAFGRGWAPLYRRLNRQSPWRTSLVEHLPQYPPIFPQVTLSYGVFEGKLNIIKLPGPFSPEEDPSRWVWGRNCRESSHRSWWLSTQAGSREDRLNFLFRYFLCDLR